MCGPSVADISLLKELTIVHWTIAINISLLTERRHLLKLTIEKRMGFPSLPAQGVKLGAILHQVLT